MNSFTLAGAVPADNLYVNRSADEELYGRLSQNMYCYMLAPRQVGKSSLAQRTRRRLMKDGIDVVYFDCQSAISETTLEGLWGQLGEVIQEELRRQNPELPSWESFCRQSGANATTWLKYIRDIAMLYVTRGLVIMLDEIDVLLSLPFNTDMFFATLRTLHMQRETCPRLKQFSVCVLGVARVADLMRDPQLSPFNVITPITLKDFSEQEARGFLPALEPVFKYPERILNAAYSWTTGHPYMLQNVLNLATSMAKGNEDPSINQENTERFIERVVHNRFSPTEEDAVLGAARRQFEADKLTPDRLNALNQYRLLLAGQPLPIVDGQGRDVQELLRIAGMVAFIQEENGEARLRIRNRIFRKYLGPAWISDLIDSRFYEDMAARWHEARKHPDFLLRGRLLDSAEVWLDRIGRTPPAAVSEFVRGSRAYQQKRRRSSILRWALIGPFFISISLLGSFYYFTQREQEFRQTLELQIKVLESQRNLSTSLVEQYVKELNGLKTELQKNQGTLQEKDLTLQTLNYKRKTLESKLSRLSQTNQRDRMEIKNIQSRLSQIQKDIIFVNQERDRLQRGVESAGERIDFLKGRADVLSKELVDTRSQLNGTREELAAAKSSKEVLLRQISELRPAVQQLTERLHETQSSASVCLDTLAITRAELEGVRIQLEAAQKESDDCMSKALGTSE